MMPRIVVRAVALLAVFFGAASYGGVEVGPSLKAVIDQRLPGYDIYEMSQRTLAGDDALYPVALVVARECKLRLGFG